MIFEIRRGKRERERKKEIKKQKINRRKEDILEYRRWELSRKFSKKFKRERERERERERRIEFQKLHLHGNREG